MRRVRSLIDSLTAGMNVLGTVLIFAIMVLVNADVIGRGAFAAPIAGVPEMVSMSIVAIVFLQVAQTFRMGRFTRTEALLNAVARRSPRLRAGLELIFCAGAIVIMIELVRASWPLFVKSWERGTYEGTIGSFTAPVWPVKLIIVLGASMLLIQLALRAIEALDAFRAGSPLPENGAQQTARSESSTDE